MISARRQVQLRNLIEPQRPVPALDVVVVASRRKACRAGESPLDARQAQGLAAFKGRWVMLAIDQGACGRSCAQKLFFMRQTHASLGKERAPGCASAARDRFRSVAAGILTAHPDMTVLRAAPNDLAALFPTTGDTGLSDHIYLIDPLQNLMMRFPLGTRSGGDAQ